MLPTCRDHGVAQQTGDGHRPDSARYRRDGARHRFCGGVIHIADQTRRAAFFHPVDADINHAGPRFHPVSLHQMRDADGGDQDIRLPTQTGQVLAARMGDGHRAVTLQQQQRHRLADDVGAADHHRCQPGDITPPLIQQQHAAGRGARHQRIAAAQQPAAVFDMEAVDILVRADRIEHRRRVDLLRQR